MTNLTSKFRETVKCVDCGLFNTKIKPNYCKKSGARITAVQSTKDIYCDFFVDKTAYDPAYAGWRGVDSVPAKSVTAPQSNPSLSRGRMKITKAEAKNYFNERYKNPILKRFGKTPYSLHMIDDYWTDYIHDLYKSGKITKEKAASWLDLKQSFS